MPPINNITRMLDAKKIAYQAFETPTEKLGAAETARLLNLPPAQVFKTIVVLRTRPGTTSSRAARKPVLVVVPGTHHVDLKLLAIALNEKKMSLPAEREAEELTGLQAGGISPLALINKGFQVVIDESAKTHATINVSGGQRGLNLQLAASDLAKLTNARFAAISAVGE